MHRKAEEESHSGVLWATTRTQRGAAWAAHTSSDFGCSALGFETQSHLVEGVQPQVSVPSVAVGMIDRPSGQLDPAVAQGLGWEGDGLGSHHGQPGALVVSALQKVEHDSGPEPAGADAEAGVTDGIGQPVAVRTAPERGEPAAGVDDSAPSVSETQSLELRERGEELLGQCGVCGQPLILLGTDPVAEVVYDVVSAPQDPVVGRKPVVVELIAEISQALPALPADGVLLLRREGFGDQDIVVDRHY